MPRVNPDILRWARETSGLGLDEAAKKLDIKSARGVSGPERLLAMEDGLEEPSRSVLVRMARRYRRPLLTFYLATPPRRGERGHDFRTLPTAQTQAASGLLDALLRDIYERHSIISAAMAEEDEAFALSFVGSMTLNDGVQAVLTSIKGTLNVTADDYRACRDAAAGFDYLRGAAESAGIFVVLKGSLGSHHTQLPPDVFRGISIADPVAPLIVINDQDSKSAWGFTLVHELAHLWLGQTGVSGSAPEGRLERFCNDVAGEFFLPSSALSTMRIDVNGEFSGIKETISRFARTNNVSGTAVAYRLLMKGAISPALWTRLQAEYRDHWLDTRAELRKKSRERDGGPDYYVVRIHRLGAGLIDFVARMMGSGALTTVKAGRVLDVRGTQVQRLLEQARHGHPA